MGKAEEGKGKRLKKQYSELYNELLDLLFRHDPIGLNFEDNTDEYAPEVETILPKLKEASSPEDLRAIIHEEFIHWFGADIAGPESHYEKIATDVWISWKWHVNNSPDLQR